MCSELVLGNSAIKRDGGVLVKWKQGVDFFSSTLEKGKGKKRIKILLGSGEA